MNKALVVFATALSMAPVVRSELSADPIVEGFKQVEAASVADAMEQLYGRKQYMSHDMRPLSTTKFAGRAVTVYLKKEEHTEGARALQGMLDAIDESAPGSVYVMVLETGSIMRASAAL